MGSKIFILILKKIFNPLLKTRNNQIKQQQLSEKQVQALHDSSQTTTQAMENQAKTIQEFSNAFNKNLQKSGIDGIQEYDEITNRNYQLLAKLVNSNQVDSSIVKTVSLLPNDKNKNQFTFKPVEGSSIFSTINPQLLILNKYYLKVQQ